MLCNVWVSESTDTIKASDSHDCRFCHYWYFLKIIICYQSLLCNGCNNIMKISIGLNYVAVVTLKRNVYGIDFGGMRKSEVVNMTGNTDLHETGFMWKRNIYIFYHRMNSTPNIKSQKKVSRIKIKTRLGIIIILKVVKKKINRVIKAKKESSKSVDIECYLMKK